MNFENVIKALHEGKRFTRKGWTDVKWICEYDFNCVLGLTPNGELLDNYQCIHDPCEIEEFKVAPIYLMAITNNKLVAWTPDKADALALDWVEVTATTDLILYTATANTKLDKTIKSRLVTLKSIADLDNIQHHLSASTVEMLKDTETRNRLNLYIEKGSGFIFWLNEINKINFIY